MPKTPKSKTGNAADDTRRKEPAVKHVLRTGLPPGVSVSDAKDPGNTKPPRGPTDNRS